MNEPWTPGPWGWERYEERPEWMRLTDASLDPDMTPAVWLANPDPDIITAAPDEYWLIAANPADARLIALAPEMAELLAEWLAALEAESVARVEDEDVGIRAEAAGVRLMACEEAARSLLARARGEQ